MEEVFDDLWFKKYVNKKIKEYGVQSKNIQTLNITGGALTNGHQIHDEVNQEQINPEPN